jgi:hypothetical protein
MKNMKSIYPNRISKIRRGIVATPNSFEDLQSLKQTTEAWHIDASKQCKWNESPFMTQGFVYIEIEVGEAVTKGCNE